MLKGNDFVFMMKFLDFVDAFTQSKSKQTRCLTSTEIIRLIRYCTCLHLVS